MVIIQIKKGLKMSENGKGDSTRPKSITMKKWIENYERIFRKKEDKK